MGNRSTASEQTAKLIQKLRRKAAKNLLEVEHLFLAARLGDASVVAAIREMQRQYEWPQSNLVNEEHVAPLGRWADVVCRYIEEGHDGLVALAKDSECRTFCIGLLEDLASAGSVRALVQICTPVLVDPKSHLSLAVRCSEAFNLLLSFNSLDEIGEDKRAEVRGFLHRLLGVDLTAAQRSTVICALRGVGDEESIRLIESSPSLDYPWHGTKETACKAIRTRLRLRSSTPR